MLPKAEHEWFMSKHKTKTSIKIKDKIDQWLCENQQPLKYEKSIPEIASNEAQGMDRSKCERFESNTTYPTVRGAYIRPTLGSSTLRLRTSIPYFGTENWPSLALPISMTNCFVHGTLILKSFPVIPSWEHKFPKMNKLSWVVVMVLVPDFPFRRIYSPGCFLRL